MRQYIPAFELTPDVKTMHEVTDLYCDKYGWHEQTLVCKDTIDFAKLRPADIIYFDEDGDKEVDHAGIYIGNKEFIHCTKQTKGVSIMPLKGVYKEHFVDAKRILADEIPQSMNTEMWANGNGYVYSDTSFNSDNKIAALSSYAPVILDYYTKLTWTSDYDCASISFFENDEKGYIASSDLTEPDVYDEGTPPPLIPEDI